MYACHSYIVSIRGYVASSENAVTVQRVKLEVFNNTAVTVSWKSIQDYPVDFYTVVYSRLSQGHRRQEIRAVFTPPATSGVIDGLDSATDYQFQVFATATVDGVTLEGERSAPVTSEE